MGMSVGISGGGGSVFLFVFDILASDVRPCLGFKPKFLENSAVLGAGGAARRIRPSSCFLVLVNCAHPAQSC